MTNTEESPAAFTFFQERVGKTLLFSHSTPCLKFSSLAGFGRRKDRKKFLNVHHDPRRYSTWTEFEWDRCLLLEVYYMRDPRCDAATLLSDESHYSGFEVAAKIYVDSAVHFVKVRVDDFTDPPGEDENV